MNKNQIITYKWTGYGWEEWDRRVTIPMSRPKSYDKSNPKPSVRQRPCWWNNGTDQVLDVVQPFGYTKGKLPQSYASKKRRHPCVRCGRAFYSKREFLSHECINAK